MNTKELESKVVGLIVSLYKKRDDYVQLIEYLWSRRRFTDKLPTMAVNKNFVLLINPAFLSSLNEEQLEFAFKHECGHVLYGHLKVDEKSIGLDGKKANVAMDLEINSRFEYGLVSGIQAWHPRMIGMPENLTWLEYYRMLPDGMNQAAGSGGNSNNELDDKDHKEQEGSKDSGHGCPCSYKCSREKIKDNDDLDSQGSLSVEDREKLEEIINKLEEKIRVRQGNDGKSSQGRSVREDQIRKTRTVNLPILVEDRLDVVKVGLFSSLCSSLTVLSDYIRRDVSRLPNVVLAIDCSGSMVKNFPLVNYLARKLKGSCNDLVYILADGGSFKVTRSWKNEFVGLGGSDFSDMGKLVATRFSDYYKVFVTDGQIDYQGPQFDLVVLVGADSEHNNVHYGKKVIVISSEG